MKPDIPILLADVESVRTRCEEALDWLAREKDAEVARSAGTEFSGIPLALVRQQMVRGDNVFDACARLLKEKV